MTTVRICTWNLEAATSSPIVKGQRELLDEINAHVVVMTEVPPSRCDDPGRSTALSRPDHRAQKVWAGISVCMGAELEQLCTQNPLAVAAMVRVDGEAVVVYGSVLPWLAAPSQVPHLCLHAEEPSPTMFERVLATQAAEVRSLQQGFPDVPVVWAGDFNQTLKGPHWGGSAHRADLLAAALESLGMEAWNLAAPHALKGMSTIELICGPKGQGQKPLHFDARHAGRTLSDHAAYAVDFIVNPTSPIG